MLPTVAVGWPPAPPMQPLRSNSKPPRAHALVIMQAQQATGLRTPFQLAQPPRARWLEIAPRRRPVADAAAPLRQFGRTRDLLCRPPEHARRWRWRRRSLKKRELVRRGASRSIRISSRRGRPASRAASHTRTHSATSQAKRTELTGALRASRES